MTELSWAKPYHRRDKQGNVVVSVKLIIPAGDDLMVRGGDFYAARDRNTNLWTRQEKDVLAWMDDMVREEASRLEEKGEKVLPLYMWDADSGMIDKWHKYVKQQLRDSYHDLDDKLIFSNQQVKPDDYVTGKMPYALEPGDISAWTEEITTLYDDSNVHKQEWCIGSIVAGDSKKIQKCAIYFGGPGTGKSTMINHITDMFVGHVATIVTKDLGAGKDFALESLASSGNPLVAVEHDGDLSKIKDNTMLNSLVSHETMSVNEKFKSKYAMKFNAFIFMGTNSPVLITDAKSGLTRRIIDIEPKGKGTKIPRKRYDELEAKIKFELGAIAYHCLQVYLDDPRYYDDYIPVRMIGATNGLYNFVMENFEDYLRDDGVSLQTAWENYKLFCAGANMNPGKRIEFQEDFKEYFREVKEREVVNGVRVRNYYKGFISDKFVSKTIPAVKEAANEVTAPLWLQLSEQKSIFDRVYSDFPAQYATDKKTPSKAWKNVMTTLSDIDTSKLHYVKPPENLIVIDFDLKDENGEKSFERNAEAASKWPETYAETSMSGQGIHLHYIYGGDVSNLSFIYDENIEIKVFTGGSSLRRKLVKCNDIPIASINSGLPLKEEVKKTINFEGFKNDKALRTMIARNLRKELVPSTIQSVTFIHDDLERAYNDGLEYSIDERMQTDIRNFALNSSHHKQECLKLFMDMKFHSDDIPKGDEYATGQILFFDFEVFINLIVLVFKAAGKDPAVWINPTPEQIQWLGNFKMVGFNCRKYDNHIAYAIQLGWSIEEVYQLSQDIISGEGNPFFANAYNWSYTDIYDYATKKQSLKKWEIQLGIHHLELGLPWDQPVPEELWKKVGEYCINDVVSTEAVWNATQGDFTAREILSKVTGKTVNDTTNQLTTALIFQGKKNPQSDFNYRDLSQPVFSLKEDVYDFLKKNFPLMMSQKHGPEGSLLPYFPGYKYEYDKERHEYVSTYKGYEVGEGGFVWAAPGIHGRSESDDSNSHHPTSATTECLFGPEAAQRFWDLKTTRKYIKHKQFDKAKEMFGGQFAEFLDDPKQAKALSAALKLAINSVYGLTAAKFPNAFRDPRNRDNIVAKRGALFMVDLLEAVQARGWTVIHIKTDSIKIADPTPEKRQFIFDFGQKYGYTFEVEHSFDKICLVNDSVYVAKLAEDDPEEPGEWIATGTEFQVPFIFKTLFSHEPIQFYDMCETKSVTSAIYLDMNEELPEDFHDYHFVGKVGHFCPILPGHGGGELVRDNKGKMASVGGTKGYRWLESEYVKANGLEDYIDKSYYISKVDAAIDHIRSFENDEWSYEDFVS